jgi:RNA polymerase sigma-70 factor (ECF subfamily)
MKVLKETMTEVGAGEDALVLQAQNGSTAAFEQIIVLYQKRIFKMAYGYLKNTEDAKEVVQETFMKLYRSIGSYQQGSRFSSWLYRIAANLCVDHYRKNKLRAEREGDTDSLVGDHYQVAETEDPETHMTNETMKGQIHDAVALLSKQEQKVFMLKHFSHMKYQEIAEVMGISVGTVKSTHHRAVANIRKRVVAQEGRAS